MKLYPAFKTRHLSFGERLSLVFALMFIVHMTFPQFTHAAIATDVRRDLNASSVFEISMMRARGEALTAPRQGDVMQRSVNPLPARRTIWVLVTAYSSTPDQTDASPFIGARGTFVRDGMVAANFLSFGTRLRFPDHFGGKEFFVEDRMNQRYARRIDIWMPTREEAKQWGARWVKVEVL